MPSSHCQYTRSATSYTLSLHDALPIFSWLSANSVPVQLDDKLAHSLLGGREAVASLSEPTGLVRRPVTPHASLLCFDLPHDILVGILDRKSTRLNSSHVKISYAVFSLSVYSFCDFLYSFPTRRSSDLLLVECQLSASST